MANLTTPKAYLSYAHLWTPHAPPNTDSKPKYSADLLFLPDQDISVITNAIKAAIAAQWPNGAPAFGPHRMCLTKIDGETGKMARFNGGYRLKAKSDPESGGRPGLVYNDTDRTEIIDRGDLYSRCVVIGRIGIYATTKGGPGVFAGLNGIMKMADVPAEERFDSKEDKEKMFGDVAPEADAGPTTATPGNGAAQPSAAPTAANPWD